MLMEEIYSNDAGTLARACAISEDGQYYAKGDNNNEVKVYEYTTGNVITTFTEHTESVIFIDFSPDGTHILSVGEQGTVEVWEFMTGTVVNTYSDSNISYSGIAKFDNSGANIISGNAGNSVMWEYDTGTEVRSFDPFDVGITGSYNDASVSANGNYLAISSSITGDNKVGIFEISTGTLINTLVGDTGGTLASISVDFSPKEEILAVGNAGGYVSFWDYLNNEEYTDKRLDNSETAGGSVQAVSTVKFSPNGQYLFMGSLNAGVIDIVDVENNSILDSFTSHLNENINKIDISPNGEYLVSAGDDKLLVSRLVDITGKVLFKDKFGSIIDSNTDYLVYDLFIGEPVVSGETSEIYEVGFVNKTGVDIVDVDITASNEATGIDLLVSSTEDPFEDLQQLTFAGPILDGAEQTFYVKLSTTNDASIGTGNVTLNITASGN